MAQSTSALEPNLQADENALATDKETRPAASASASTCPNEFLCPITKSLLRDPVLLVETGHSFERWAIQRWFAQGNMTCPLTGVALASIQVTPNLALRKLIQDWAARHPTHSAVLQSGPSTQDLYPQPNAAAALANGAQALPAFPPFAQALVNRRNAIGPVGRLIPCNPPRFFGGHVAQIQEAPLPAADDDEALDESARTPASEGEAPPAADPTLTLIPEFDTIGALPQEMLAVAHVVAPETGVRVPVDLVAVLDMSGSMAGPRLALVKETMMFVISQLQPSDRLSIVAFSHVAQRAIKLTRATETGKAQMRAAVQALSTQGGTSIASGLRLGLHVLTSRRMRNPVACMFCLSDGQDNAGGPMPPGDSFAVRNRELLTSALREGVSVHTFGYGRDHDEEVLDSIAAGTSGTFTFIRDNCEVKEAVALSLGGALSVALQATTVQLTAAPGVAILAVSAGVYEATVDEAQASASVALKDLYSGETRDILIKLQLPAVSDETPPTPSLFGQLSYTLPGSADACQSPLVTLSLGRSGNSEQASPNIDVDIQRNRLKAAEAMREADRLAGGANLVLARGVIESTIDFIRGSPSAQEPACVGLLADLQQILRGLADARDYQSEGAKYAKSAARMHSSQRAAFTSTTGREPRGNAAMDQYASMSAISMRRTATIDNS